MKNETLYLLSLLSLLFCLVGFASTYRANNTSIEFVYKLSLVAYLIFVILGFLIIILNIKNIEFRNEILLASPLFLLVPMVNFLVLIIFIVIATKHIINYIQKKISIKEKNKIVKKYPQLVSLNALKEIYEIINVKDYLNEELLVEKPITGYGLNQLIVFLEKNYLCNEYSNLLSNYEFTFIKLISIYKENIAIENLISSDIFMSSKKILEQFSHKVQDAKNNIKNNKSLEKEMKNSIESQTRDVTKRRLLNEINEEFKFHE